MIVWVCSLQSYCSLKTQEQPLDHALLGFDEYLVATNYIALSVSALLAGDRAVAGGDVHACLRASAKLVLVSPDNVSSSTCTRLISRCPMPIRTNIFCKLKRQKRSARCTGQ